MRARTALAAAASALGAAVAHALDASGRLPGVHEAVAVRTAMGPVGTVAWLLLAAAVGALVARAARPVVPALAGALAVAAVPELVGRLDPGAIGEPAALAGAALQATLLLAVVGAITAFGTLWLTARPGPRPSPAPTNPLPCLSPPRPRAGRRPHGAHRGRAPPYVVA